MRGSGIYSQEVEYDEFDCENEECGKHNEAGNTSTDDWGNYEVRCEFCDTLHFESSLDDDREADRADADYDAWRDSQLD